MTRADLNEIINVIESEKSKQKMYCSEYVKNNPDDKCQRERYRDIAISTLNKVQNDIIQLYKSMSA